MHAAPGRPFLRRSCGFLVGLLAAVLLGEAVTRLRLPDDLQPFLGEDSSLAGNLRPDPELGADYRSLADFRAPFAARLAELEALEPRTRTWVWLGNSFAQAPGMLGDMAQETLPEVKMFFLRRNAELPLQVAQIRWLLGAGLEADRILLVVLPIDTVPLGRQPFVSRLVNHRGALTYRLRLPPPPFDALIRSSRLAQLAWVRSGKHVGNPAFKPRHVTEFVAPALQEDLSTLFRVLGATTRAHGVPVTVLLLPNREQIFGQAGYAVQDFLRERSRVEGLDCFDARDLFADESDKLSLFLPDWHFTEKANRIVLQALLAHLSVEPAPGPTP